VCCSVLHCVALCCSELQQALLRASHIKKIVSLFECCESDTHCNTHCNTLCNTHCYTHCTTHCNTHCITRCNTHCHTHCNTHTATHTAIHTATHTATHCALTSVCCCRAVAVLCVLQCSFCAVTYVCYSELQCVAVCCSLMCVAV